MTWKDVFDGTKCSLPTIDFIAQFVANKTRYKFLCHNGDIYFVTPDGNYHKTGLTSHDLK